MPRVCVRIYPLLLQDPSRLLLGLADVVAKIVYVPIVSYEVEISTIVSPRIRLPFAHVLKAETQD